MTGYHEVRVDGPRRQHYRLFCRLDTTAKGKAPLLTVLAGATKPFRTEFPDAVIDTPLGDLLRVEPHEVADLQVGNPLLGHRAGRWPRCAGSDPSRARAPSRFGGRG